MHLVLHLIHLVRLCTHKVGAMRIRAMRIMPNLLPRKPRPLCSDTISPVSLCCCLGVPWGTCLLLDRPRAIALSVYLHCQSTFTLSACCCIVGLGLGLHLPGPLVSDCGLVCWRAVSYCGVVGWRVECLVICTHHVCVMPMICLLTLTHTYDASQSSCVCDAYDMPPHLSAIMRVCQQNCGVKWRTTNNQPRDLKMKTRSCGNMEPWSPPASPPGSHQIFLATTRHSACTHRPPALPCHPLRHLCLPCPPRLRVRVVWLQL